VYYYNINRSFKIMKKPAFWLLSLLAVAAFFAAGFFCWKNLRGLEPVFRESPQDITELIPASGNDQTNASEGENQTDFPLKLPAGFTISIFARDLPLVRVITFDSAGNIWLSRTRTGAITRLEIKNGEVAGQSDIFRNLRNPHGLVFDPEDPQQLYIAEEDKIFRVRIGDNNAPQKIADLPAGAGHSTRTLLFGTDGKLYVSIGSSCNVCAESDLRRAKVFSLNKDGSDFKEFARGLRNSVFMVNHPESEKIWATDMGRDHLGDNLPPEEVNILEEGADYGWPYCYGENIHDDNFDKNRNVSCEGKTPPMIEYQAHSAPLGLAFVPEDSNWPDEYKNNLLVAYHGSWNRSEPSGYKIIRFKTDKKGNITKSGEDLVTGWMAGGSGREAGNIALGRPVDIKFHESAMYVSDDKAGVIYKIVYSGQ
jgi:glucose/arabinose dehydrogenase